MIDEPNAQDQRDAEIVERLKHAAKKAAEENHAQGDVVRYIEDYFSESNFEDAIHAAIRVIDRKDAEIKRLRDACEDAVNAIDLVYGPVRSARLANCHVTLSNAALSCRIALGLESED